MEPADEKTKRAQIALLRQLGSRNLNARRRAEAGLEEAGLNDMEALLSLIRHEPARDVEKRRRLKWLHWLLYGGVTLYPAGSAGCQEGVRNGDSRTRAPLGASLPPLLPERIEKRDSRRTLLRPISTATEQQEQLLHPLQHHSPDSEICLLRMVRTDNSGSDRP